MAIMPPPASPRRTIATDTAGMIIPMGPITPFAQRAVVHTIVAHPTVVRDRHIILHTRLHILRRLATQMEKGPHMVDITVVLRMDGVKVTEAMDPTAIRREVHGEAIIIITLIRARIGGEGDVENDQRLQALISMSFT